MARTTRSVESTEPVYLRFLNCTGRTVKVYWIDYEGNRKLYRELSLGESTDINTFVTHPWQFNEKATGDLLMVYYPSALPGYRYHLYFSLQYFIPLLIYPLTIKNSIIYN
jgi:hypothetical protein